MPIRGLEITVALRHVGFTSSLECVTRRGDFKECCKPFSLGPPHWLQSHLPQGTQNTLIPEVWTQHLVEL